MGKYSQKSNTYTQKFKKENYDTITVYVPKGKRKTIQEYASSIGHSSNSLLNALIDIELDSKSLKNTENGSM